VRLPGSVAFADGKIEEDLICEVLEPVVVRGLSAPRSAFAGFRQVDAMAT
jgi:hypothetical protein